MTQPSKNSTVESQTIAEQLVEKEVTLNDAIKEFDSNTSGYKNAIKSLLANGAKRINGVKIKNVNFTEKDNYTMVSFTLINSIKGFVSNDNGMTYEIGVTNTLFSSLYAIVGTVKEDEDLAWMGNTLLEKPTALNLIFNGGTLDVIQQTIAAGEEYINPFSTNKDVNPVIYDHDIIINHIVSFKLGKTGEKMADRLAGMLMSM